MDAQPDEEAQNLLAPVSFSDKLTEHDLTLTRGKTVTAQINTGLLCNQACKHCHLGAGPDKKEVMTPAVMDEVVEYVRRGDFEMVDITGGAPEMVPDIEYLVKELSRCVPNMIFRSNLTAIGGNGYKSLLKLLADKKVSIVASLPSLNMAQVDSQRGTGVFDKSIESLRKFNAVGYGCEKTGLMLSLAVNPSGAFLASPQVGMEKKFKRDLLNKHNIVFNNLFTFNNVPVGRYRGWLESSGNMAGYILKLADSFNSCAVSGAMCRTQVSVNWDGYLYDCDFNLAEAIPLGGVPTHISETSSPPEEGTEVAVSDHCYACTAGAGFTCGGAIDA